MKKGFIIIKKLVLAMVLFFAVVGLSDVKDAKAAFEAKHYDIRENGGTWDGNHYYDANGNLVKDAFFCDGTYTYFLQADGTPMKDRLTYHPDGEHIIYFDSEGHEVFSDFTRVLKSISGEDVYDLCFFDVFGYMYVDVLTYDKEGENLYYANQYGVIEESGWFQFATTPGGVGEAFGIKPGMIAFSYPAYWGIWDEDTLTFITNEGVIAPESINMDTSQVNKFMLETDGCGLYVWDVLCEGMPRPITKEQADSLMTTITVNVWDFENNHSMNKVTKSLHLVVNKHMANYVQQAMADIYNSPDQPVINPATTGAYSYRNNVNNPSNLSGHAYGKAIDFNSVYNPNGSPAKTYEEWLAMPEGTIKEQQTKAYTFYDGCTVVRIMCDEYGFDWIRDYDPMHFELPCMSSDFFWY